MKRKLVRTVAPIALVSAALGCVPVGCGGPRAYCIRAGTSSSGSAAGCAAAPLGSLPAIDEEVWVIVRPETRVEAFPAAPADAGVPGTGVMMGRRPGAGDDVEVPLPLRHTAVEASLTGYIAEVNVRQEFTNPYDEKIEAVYVFPLPQNAAVSEFVMQVGERRIRGIIRARPEAERLYAEAKAQGYVASLLTQERPNVFTQSVANIEPGREIDVDVTYFHTLPYHDGWYEYVFPMVVGPRFNPPGFTGGIGAVPRGGAAGRSGQATEVSYLAPGERSGHDVSLRVTIDAGVPVEEIACRSHVVETTALHSSRAVVTLSPRDAIPNRDFVLRYRVAGDTVKAGLLAQRDEREGGRGAYFALMVVPPREIGDLARAPVEMVFVVDCSGSMRGDPLDQAKRAVERALMRLGPEDTFQVIRFSNDSSALGPAPRPATDANVRRGVRYVHSLHSGGGTMMIRGIRAALGFAPDPERRRYVVFLTDGHIGNDAEILGEVQSALGDARIFSFGIGSAPNRYLMDRMAKLGAGAVAYIGRGDSAPDVMDRFVERVSHPALANLAFDWGGATVGDVFPARVPDLFVGRPVVLTGRFEGDAPPLVRVRGDAAGVRVETTVRAVPDEEAPTRALPAVWARMQIADLMDRATVDADPGLADRVRDIALEYGLVSAYTAFIAVDSSRRTEGDRGTTVPVAVPVPEGVHYETTVADPGGEAAAGWSGDADAAPMRDEGEAGAGGRLVDGS